MYKTALAFGAAQHSSTIVVCDNDDTNNNTTCLQDCAGIWGGNATVDNCGVCDDEPNNDNTTCACSGGPIEADEVCDGNDNDCDGVIDENTADVCTEALDGVETAQCTDGFCQPVSCADNFSNLDGVASNGCECQLRNGGVETCNEFDDDCDGQVNEDIGNNCEFGTAPPTIRAIPFVPTRPDLPHPVMNNEPTILQAIADDSNCNDLNYRWDVNGDGDFNDANEQWRDTQFNQGPQRYRPLGLAHTFPASQYEQTFYPRVQIACDGDVVDSVTVPYRTLGSAACTNYPQPPQSDNYEPAISCTSAQNDRLTRRHYTQASVDRALWYLFTQFNHYDDDGVGNTIPTCLFDTGMEDDKYHLFNQGHALSWHFCGVGMA